jgi:hypothetical protein
MPQRPPLSLGWQSRCCKALGNTPLEGERGERGERDASIQRDQPLADLLSIPVVGLIELWGRANEREWQLAAVADSDSSSIKRLWQLATVAASERRR